MRPCWLRLLLLSTFVFWATGAAKYAHEALEHHGRDASVDDDDDDDDNSVASSSITSVAGHTKDQSHPPAKHACPVCQMLAAMVVDRSAPPVLPQLSLRLIATLVVVDHAAPLVPARFARSARAPPSDSTSV